MKIRELEDVTKTPLLTPLSFRREYIWNEKVSPDAPFWLPRYTKERWEADWRVPGEPPFPYRVIKFKIDRLCYVAVRTDHYPLMWAWWWFWLRVEESWEITKQYINYLRGIWRDAA